MCYDYNMFIQPTILDHLIAFLLSANSSCLYRRNLWLRIKAKRQNLRAEAFRQHIYRLNKNGVIKTDGEMIYIHKRNLSRFIVKNNSVMKNISPGKTQKVLVSFDIPEVKKKTRDWLRNQIRFWGFKMIHKSLWLGSGPLPKEFNNRLRQLGIDGNVKVFKVLLKPHNTLSRSR